MRVTFSDNTFVAQSNSQEAQTLEQSGFKFHPEYKVWYTQDAKVAEKMVRYFDQAAILAVRSIKQNLQNAIVKSASSESTLKLYYPPEMVPRPYQVAGVEYILSRNGCILADEQGLGKGLWVEEKIITPDGLKRIGDLKSGDFVTGSDGKPTKVIGVYPQGKRKLYRFTFNDGVSILADEDHLWAVNRRTANELTVLSTKQLLNKKEKVTLFGKGHNELKKYTSSTYYKKSNGDLKWSIPMVLPIHFSSRKNLPMDPYLLGLLLGDGNFSTRRIRIFQHKNDFLEILQGLKYKENKPEKNIRIASFQHLLPIIKKIGLHNKKSHNKFIPEIFRYSLPEERLELLRGLMDTDGTPLSDKSSGTEYCTVSEQLANDVCEIVHSLGGIVRIRTKIPTYTYKGEKKIGKKAYRLNIKLPKGVNPFKLKRKANKYKLPSEYLPSRWIKKIEYEREGESICIKVAAKDSLYVMKHGIVTHNTAQAILAMNMRKDVECVIVCLSILKINWLKEIRKWLIGTVKAIIYEGKKLKVYEKKLTDHPKTTRVHIINYDILKTHCMRISYLPYNSIIFDESHYIKNREADRTKAGIYLARKAKYKLFITGTPIFNKPPDLYVPLNLIDPETFPNFQEFKEKYCGDKSGGYIKKTTMQDLNQVLRSKYMVRRMVTDVAKDLPEKMKDVVILSENDLNVIVEREQTAVKMSKEREDALKADIARLKEMGKGNINLEAEYKSKVKALREIKFKNFGEISKIRKELAIKKIPYVIDFVKESLESSEDKQSKIVIFAHHTEVVEAIFAGLKKYKPVKIHGGVTDKNRQQAIDLFSAKNDHRAAVLSIKSAGTGVDGLQHNCNVMVFCELDWTPSGVAQAESRLLRIGQTKPVLVYHIVADGSIDGKIAKMLVAKENVNRQILDFKEEEFYDHVLNSK